MTQQQPTVSCVACSVPSTPAALGLALLPLQKERHHRLALTLTKELARLWDEKAKRAF